MLLVAPDKFKGTATADEVAEALAAGWRSGDGTMAVDCCPVADGGEGTLECLSGPLGLRRVEFPVLDPLGRRITAHYGLSERSRSAVVELALASGLGLVAPHLRDPTRTTTFGTGQLIAAAAAAGAKRIIVALGGSATCDGGAGLAQAMGVRFRDRDGADLVAPLAGGDLLRVVTWTPPESSRGLGAEADESITIEAATDVDSPLLGPLGAARLFAPQKGATLRQVEELESALAALVEARCTASEERPDLAGGVSGDGIRRGKPCRTQAEILHAAGLPGAGAAGGCGFGLRVFCGAVLRPGAELVLEAVRFHERLDRAALVLTGEGRLDPSSLRGKSAIAVAKAARARGVPVVCVVGDVDSSEVSAATGPGGTFDELIVLAHRFGREQAMREPLQCLRVVGRELAGRGNFPGR